MLRAAERRQKVALGVSRGFVNCPSPPPPLPPALRPGALDALESTWGDAPTTVEHDQRFTRVIVRDWEELKAITLSGTRNPREKIAHRG